MVTRMVAQLTGPGSINATHTRWNVYGTDLGHSFVHRDRVYLVFGDTYGDRRSHPRSNVLAWTEDHDPSDGLQLSGMITDLDGRAKELLPSSWLRLETTIIPTYGVSLGDRMVLHYMSVRLWGSPGRWTLNYSGLAFSDDDGYTWSKSSSLRWRGRSNWGQVALVPSEGFVYLFGIPAGRFGGVKLARVPRDGMLNAAAYEYWDGREWRARAEATAATIVAPPVGELSVRWNSYTRRWLMMYLNEHMQAIVLRSAEHLTGPWGEERVIVTAAEYPQLYAPYTLPRWSDGPDIYFTMSLFGPYNVYLMHASVDFS